MKSERGKARGGYLRCDSRYMMRYDHQGRTRTGEGRRRRLRRASRAVRWIFGWAEAWNSGKLVLLQAKFIAKSFESCGYDNVQTWTMAMVSGERSRRRFSAKFTTESENQAGFLAGVAVASTTWPPLLPVISV
jgi:ribosomal protein L25 (general stress protein Ctc)